MMPKLKTQYNIIFTYRSKIPYPPFHIKGVTLPLFVFYAASIYTKINKKILFSLVRTPVYTRQNFVLKWKIHLKLLN